MNTKIYGNDKNIQDQEKYFLFYSHLLLPGCADPVNGEAADGVGSGVVLHLAPPRHVHAVSVSGQRLLSLHGEGLLVQQEGLVEEGGGGGDGK